MNSAPPTIRSCSCDSALTGRSLCRDLLDNFEIAVMPGIVLCAQHLPSCRSHMPFQWHFTGAIWASFTIMQNL